MYTYWIYLFTEELNEAAEQFELGLGLSGIDDDDIEDNTGATDILLGQPRNFTGLTSFNRTRWNCLLKMCRSHLDNFGKLIQLFAKIFLSLYWH